MPNDHNPAKHRELTDAEREEIHQSWLVYKAMCAEQIHEPLRQCYEQKMREVKAEADQISLSI